MGDPHPSPLTTPGKKIDTVSLIVAHIRQLKNRIRVGVRFLDEVRVIETVSVFYTLIRWPYGTEMPLKDNVGLLSVKCLQIVLQK